MRQPSWETASFTEIFSSQLNHNFRKACLLVSKMLQLSYQFDRHNIQYAFSLTNRLTCDGPQQQHSTYFSSRFFLSLSCSFLLLYDWASLRVSVGCYLFIVSPSGRQNTFPSRRSCIRRRRTTAMEQSASTHQSAWFNISTDLPVAEAASVYLRLRRLWLLFLVRYL